MIATIEGVVLDASDATSSPYTITAIDGWDDGVDTRRESIDRPGAHGQFLLPGYLGGRLITIDGEIYTASEPEQDQAVLRLTGILAAGGSGQLTVQSDTGSQRTRVQRNGPPNITRDRWGLLATYQLQLWAPDPRKYGTERTYTAGQEAFHRGNFPASPVLEITGPTPAYTVSTDIGHQLTIGQALTAGQVHRIELRSGRLWRDGVLQVGAISGGSSWTIPAGIPGVVHAITGTGSLTVKVVDTFV